MSQQKCKHTILDKHCPSCQKLQQQWTKKLTKSGFEDIERDEDRLKFYSSEFFSKDYPIEVRFAKQEYFQYATSFLNEYKFETKRDRIIWEYHSNGISMRDIVKLLKKVRIKTNKTDVCKAISKMKRSLYAMYLAPKVEYHE